MEVVLGMFFLTFNNVDIQFVEKELTWRTYTTKDTLPTTCQVKYISQKKFVKAVIDENIKAFVIHISSLGLRITIKLAREGSDGFIISQKSHCLGQILGFRLCLLGKVSKCIFKVNQSE